MLFPFDLGKRVLGVKLMVASMVGMLPGYLSYLLVAKTKWRPLTRVGYVATNSPIGALFLGV